MSHSPSPEHEGGCRTNDLNWGNRKIEFGDMSWEEAKKVARIAAGELENGHPCERVNDVTDMLGAAGIMPASAFEADSADEVEYEVAGWYSEDD
jgi:hypothetical protein